MNEETGLLSVDAAEKLLATADGNAALLYLQIQLCGGRFSLTEAARTLRRSEADIALAAETLRRVGLMPRPEAPLPDETLPQLTVRDLKDVASKDTAFQGLVSEAEKVLGRVLSDNDLRILFGIYDHLGLPADVIMVLMNHCVEEYQLRCGPGRMPTMRYIEKEAWLWAGQEIVNLDAAEEHLRRHRRRREAAEQTKEALGIRGRELTVSEKKYVDEWLSLGFGPEAIAIAYDRTVLNTGKLNWKYMDSIMKSWNDKGLHAPEEIEAKDPGRRPKKTFAEKPAMSDDEKIERMKAMAQKWSAGKAKGGAKP